MNKEEKRQFILSLTRNVVERIIAEKLNKMPGEWDEYELLLYTKDQFSQLTMGTMTRKRKKAYNNALITRGL